MKIIFNLIDGSKREFSLVWFNLDYDNEQNAYLLTAYKNQKNSYCCVDSTIIHNLRIDAVNVSSIEIVKECSNDEKNSSALDITNLF